MTEEVENKGGDLGPPLMTDGGGGHSHDSGHGNGDPHLPTLLLGSSGSGGDDDDPHGPVQLSYYD